MTVHAFSTGTVAIKHRRIRGAGPGPLRPLITMTSRGWSEPLPIWVWIIEHPEGLIAVDTGETARALEPGYFPRWNPYFRFAVRGSGSAETEIGPQMRAAGLDPLAVRKVVLTHMHTDHAGGLASFPETEVIVSSRELAEATGPLAKVKGYLPHRWPEGFTPRAVEIDGEPWGPFEHSLAVTDTGDVRILPTPGHTPGHVSVVVEENGAALLFAGDTSYEETTMLEGTADGVTQDPATARATLARIRELCAARPTVYLPTHDPGSANRLERRAVTR